MLAGAVLTKTQTSLEVAEKLEEHVFSTFGAPLTIVSDQDKSFNANLLSGIMTLYGITKTRTNQFHPRSNGKVKVFIRTLKQHLCMLVRQDQKDWPKYLPIINQVYRAIPVSSTSFSPYGIMFGVPMRLPIDLLRGELPDVPSYHKSSGGLSSQTSSTFVENS